MNVLVAVVVDTIDPTVSIDEVAVIDVPSNHTSDRLGIDDELVPPLAIPTTSLLVNTLVTSVSSSSSSDSVSIDVVDILLLNTDQSADVRQPNVVAFDVSHVTLPFRYVRPVPNVVVDTHVGVVPFRASICPDVPLVTADTTPVLALSNPVSDPTVRLVVLAVPDVM
jgi:hypothetical protein